MKGTAKLNTQSLPVSLKYKEAESIIHGKVFTIAGRIDNTLKEMPDKIFSIPVTVITIGSDSICHHGYRL